MLSIVTVQQSAGWSQVTGIQCCVKSIAIKGNDIYGSGTDNRVYKNSLDGSRGWQRIIGPAVVSIAIKGNDIYGVGTDNRVYKNPLDVSRAPRLSVGNHRLHVDGVEISTKGLLNEHTLKNLGYLYIGSSFTRDFLRHEGQDTHFIDAKNYKWNIPWGWHLNGCFASTSVMYWRQGSVSERSGFDRQTDFICCTFMKKSGGWFRDDFTEVSCSAFKKSSPGIANTDIDWWGRYIELVKVKTEATAAAAAAINAVRP